MLFEEWVQSGNTSDWINLKTDVYASVYASEPGPKRFSPLVPFGTSQTSKVMRTTAKAIPPTIISGIGAVTTFATAKIPTDHTEIFHYPDRLPSYSQRAVPALLGMNIVRLNKLLRGLTFFMPQTSLSITDKTMLATNINSTKNQNSDSLA